MKSRRESAIGKNGLQAATRRFPTRGPQIEALIERDENFRGMCDDLAAAEQARSAAEHLPENIRMARRLEYEELAAELTEEIERALDQANVFPMSRSPKHEGRYHEAAQRASFPLRHRRRRPVSRLCLAE
jgi:hypothetical protein